jgi:hypothetical protein
MNGDQKRATSPKRNLRARVTCASVLLYSGETFIQQLLASVFAVKFAPFLTGLGVVLALFIHHPTECSWLLDHNSNSSRYLWDVKRGISLFAEGKDKTNGPQTYGVHVRMNYPDSTNCRGYGGHGRLQIPCCQAAGLPVHPQVMMKWRSTLEVFLDGKP